MSKPISNQELVFQLCKDMGLDPGPSFGPGPILGHCLHPDLNPCQGPGVGPDAGPG